MLANASLNQPIHWVPTPPGQFDTTPRFSTLRHPILFRGLSMRKTGGCLIPVRASLASTLNGGDGEGAARRERQIEGVNTKEEVAWYCGKRMAYIYKAKTKTKGTRYRCIWGKVARPHGNSGIIRAKFNSNLPPKSMVRLKSLR
ncbi:hypothetical protein BHM03_00026230 [Ensete ventricosum]|nr:hypothetical protein BHM03_00026230 [Ensete ventricosum]